MIVKRFNRIFNAPNHLFCSHKNFLKSSEKGLDKAKRICYNRQRWKSGRNLFELYFRFTILYAGMAELADALDSGRDSSVIPLNGCQKPRLGDLTPCKNQRKNQICGYGGIGRRARFRFRHLGDETVASCKWQIAN